MRRKRGRRGTRRASKRAAPRRDGGRVRGPVVQTEPVHVVSKRRRGTREVSQTVHRSADPYSRRARTSWLSPGLLDRRDPVRQSRKTARKGMPSGLVLASRRDGDAPKNEATKVCARRKASRRAVIIATGYGGRNGFRRRKEARSCR